LLYYILEINPPLIVNSKEAFYCRRDVFELQ
jgi:hypothetical protein